MMVCGRGIKGKRAFIQALAGWKQNRGEQSGAPHGPPMDCPQNNVCPPWEMAVSRGCPGDRFQTWRVCVCGIWALEKESRGKVGSKSNT